MAFVAELRRCERCDGLDSVVVQVRDPETGEWHDRESQPRCRNELPWPPADEQRATDWLPRRCRSRRLRPLAPGDDGSTQPCPQCGGAMEWEFGGIAD